MYTIKEIYYTLQGEGRHVGRPAVFLRFSGCNLWNGREEDRGKATCQFCDTDFVGTDGPKGNKFKDSTSLSEAVEQVWIDGVGTDDNRFVVCTGGEPLLQLDSKAIEALHHKDFTVAVETNGTVPPPDGIDWTCVSPKAGSDLFIKKGDELKLIFPQAGIDPTQFENLRFDHFSLQPMDGPHLAANTAKAIAYSLNNPKWTLSLQTHKILGID